MPPIPKLNLSRVLTAYDDPAPHGNAGGPVFGRHSRALPQLLLDVRCLEVLIISLLRGLTSAGSSSFRKPPRSPALTARQHDKGV